MECRDFLDKCVQTRNDNLAKINELLSESKGVSEEVLSKFWNVYLVVDSLVVEYLICKYGHDIMSSFLENYIDDCVFISIRNDI